MTYLQFLRRPATFSKLLLTCEADLPQNTPREKEKKRKEKKHRGTSTRPEKILESQNRPTQRHTQAGSRARSLKESKIKSNSAQ
jgi:hypothetical protein